MSLHTIINSLRIAFGVLGTIGIIGLALPVENYANFFSYFTIQSNILAAGFLIGIGWYNLTPGHKRDTALLRGAVTFYLVVTGIVYTLLLSNIPSDVPWANSIAHYIMPVFVLVDWLIFPPKRHISFKSALLWLAFPLAYLVYTLVRGPIVGWYPYHFLDVATNGLGSVLGVSVAILVGGIVGIRLLTLRTPMSDPLKR